MYKILRASRSYVDNASTLQTAYALVDKASTYPLALKLYF